jgi:hypothetical protein
MPSKKTLDEALHVRLLIDNPDSLDFMDWVNGNWRQSPLGIFYADEDVLDNAIFEITQAVLKVEERTLPDKAANQLRKDVDRKTGPEEAVKQMFKAAQDAVPI